MKGESTDQGGATGRKAKRSAHRSGRTLEVTRSKIVFEKRITLLEVRNSSREGYDVVRGSEQDESPGSKEKRLFQQLWEGNKEKGKGCDHLHLAILVKKSLS